MTAAKKDKKIEEVKSAKKEKFMEYMNLYDLRDPKRDILAVQMATEANKYDDSRTYQAMDVQVALATYACLLHPHHHPYHSMLARSIQRFKSNEIREGLVKAVFNSLQGLPKEKKAEELKTPFMEDFISNDAIYLKMAKLDNEKATASSSKSGKKLVSIFAPTVDLSEVAEEFMKRSIRLDRKQREKDAEKLNNELILKRENGGEHALDNFSAAKIELCIAYIDCNNATFTANAQKTVKQFFVEQSQHAVASKTTESDNDLENNLRNDKREKLMELIQYGRERVIDTTPYYKGSTDMLSYFSS